MDDLKNNMSCFQNFKQDVGNSLEGMSQGVNEKYRLTREYQETVRMRMAELEEKVYKPADVNHKLSYSKAPGQETIVVEEESHQDSIDDGAASRTYEESNVSAMESHTNAKGTASE